MTFDTGVSHAALSTALTRTRIVASQVGSLAVDASPGGFLLLGKGTILVLARVANGTDSRVGVRG